MLAVVTPGCGGDDSCGPGGAPDDGLVASDGSASLTYGGLHAGLNGDCPATGAPAGVTSLTIAGTGAQGFITLCVSRPDLLANQPQTVELDVPRSAAQARLVDLTGTANSCTFQIDATQAASGTVSSSGLCGNGADAAGFALVVDVALALTRTCGQTVDSVPVLLRGRVAVSPQ
ncbi:MAG: hypothetical protein ABIY55_09035 [Kofleriaceae bacterium]